MDAGAVAGLVMFGLFLLFVLGGLHRLERAEARDRARADASVRLAQGQLYPDRPLEVRAAVQDVPKRAA